VRLCLTASRLAENLHDKFLIGSGLTIVDELAVSDVEDLMDLLIELGLPRIKAKATAKMMVRAVDELPVEELPPIAEVREDRSPPKPKAEKKKKKGESDMYDVQCVGEAVPSKTKKKKRGGAAMLDVGGGRFGAGAPFGGAPMQAAPMHPAQVQMLQAHQLLVAVSQNDQVAVEHLLRRGVPPHVATLADPVDRSIEPGWHALHIAACMGFAEVAHLLLAYGADPNVRQVHSRSEPGFTPLYIATRNGHIPVARLLIARGADPRVANDGGAAPVHVAAEAGNIDALKLLLEHGADPFAVDGRGRTAAAIASACGDAAVVAELTRGDLAHPESASRYLAATLGAQHSGLDSIEKLLGRGATLSGVDPPKRGWRTELGDPRLRVDTAHPATADAVAQLRQREGAYPRHAADPLDLYAAAPRRRSREGGGRRTTRSIGAIVDAALGGSAGPAALLGSAALRDGHSSMARAGMAAMQRGQQPQPRAGPGPGAVRHDIYSAPWPLPRNHGPQ
jgi:hypothetical protein